MKNLILSNKLLVIVTLIMTINFSENVFAENTISPKKVSFNNDNDAIAAEDTPCDNLREFLINEILQFSKPSKKHPNARIIGVQEENAMQKALTLIAKLNVKRLQSENGLSVYNLPGEIGLVVIDETDNDDFFIRVKFDVRCADMPFNEIHYVSLKDFNK